MLRLLMALALVLPSAHAEEKRPAFAVPDSTLSPDRRYGVTVPSTDPGQKEQEGANELIEVASGKSIVVIKAEVAFDRMNHERVLPSRW